MDAITFRPLAFGDLALLHRWRYLPHVVEWWGPPLTMPSIEAKYGPRIDRTEPTRVFLIVRASEPIGWIQTHRYEDDPEFRRVVGIDEDVAGIDVCIGEPSMLNRGIGPAAIGLFTTGVVFAEADVRACVADPDVRNGRSVRAFQKAGFLNTATLQVPDRDEVTAVLRRDR